MLARHTGATVISADDIAHELLETDADIRCRITQRWGTDCLDQNGKIDRAKLGRIIFSDPDERAELEKIMHPRIIQRIHDEIHAAQTAPARWTVLDAALLFETGLQKICDVVIYVQADFNVRAQRARQNRGWDQDQLIRRQNAQLPSNHKRNRSDYIVDNNGSIYETDKQIQEIVQSIKRHRR